jgi:hypothetical protein
MRLKIRRNRKEAKGGNMVGKKEENRKGKKQTEIERKNK